MIGRAAAMREAHTKVAFGKRPKDIAKVMINKLGKTKFEQVIRAGREILKTMNGTS